MRVAVVCPGIGHIRRGFEAFAEDLFQHLRAQGRHDVALFKGGGETNSSEFVLWNIDRGSPVWRLFAGVVDPYIGEQVTFTLSLARHLKRDSFDIIHVSDCQVASLLAHLIRGQQNRPRIVYSNGGPYDPDDYRGFDFIQQVNPVEMERAVAQGVDPTKMMLVPYGVDTDRYRPSRGTRLRNDLGIPEDIFLLLTVGSHGGHKRLEFLIAAVERITAPLRLLIVGHPSREDATFREFAERRLGDRVSFASYPREEMPNVYGSANLYVHAALTEGFGLALLEAMACGLPVVHHHEAGMNWLVGDGGVALSMNDPAQLSVIIDSLAQDPARLSNLSGRARRRAESFSWRSLLPLYSEMYGRAIRTAPNQSRRQRTGVSQSRQS